MTTLAEKQKLIVDTRRDRLWLVVESAMWKAPSNIDTYLVKQLLTPFIEALASGKPPKKAKKAAKVTKPVAGFYWPNTTDKYRKPLVWGWPQAHASKRNDVFSAEPIHWLFAYTLRSVSFDDLYVHTPGLDLLEGKEVRDAGLRDLGTLLLQEGNVRVLCHLLRAAKWRLATLVIYQMLNGREAMLATSNANFDRGRAYWQQEFAKFRETADDLTDEQAKAVVVNLLRQTAERIPTFNFVCEVPQRGRIVPLIPLRPVIVGAASRDPVFQKFCAEVWPTKHQPRPGADWEMRLAIHFDPKFADLVQKLAYQAPDNFAEAEKFGATLHERLHGGGLRQLAADGGDLHLTREENPARERVEGSADLIGQKVTVYRNLHLDTFSVRLGTKVVLHSDWVKLRDAKFVVQPGGRETVRRTKAKLVHAYISGILEDFAGEGEAPASPSLPRPIGYNPYLDDTFVARDNGEPVFTAAEVELLGTRAYGSGLNGKREGNPAPNRFLTGWTLGAALGAAGFALWNARRR